MQTPFAHVAPPPLGCWHGVPFGAAGLVQEGLPFASAEHAPTTWQASRAAQTVAPETQLPPPSQWSGEEEVPVHTSLSLQRTVEAA
ncbi:MAG TPA: hypothetical protein VGH20_06760 [Myxococcales bacterium]